jgi:integrase
LIAAGCDIEEVSARLGHSNVATTQRSYIHAFDAARRRDDRRSRLTRRCVALLPANRAP